MSAEAMTPPPPLAELEQLVRQQVGHVLAEHKRNTLIMVFSGDMDRVFTALAIANGAAAMGGQVTVYFAFWGACALRTGAATTHGKSFIERVLGRMMPAGIDRLPVSRMNCGGAGAIFFRWWMQKKRMQALSEMLTDAQDLGVKMMACQTSLEMMGLRRDELIEGLEFAGVASFLQEAARSGTVLFV